MVMPSWQDKKFGSKARAGLWLVSVVGEGEVFTKGQLREAFPDVSQIDRRVRDLRDHGWQIDTRREDETLHLEEQRFVKKGAEVWIPGQSKSPKEKSGLTAAQRTKVMMSDSFLCRSCGIGAGEEFADGGQGAQLDVARRQVLMPDGTTKMMLVTECNRCRVGGRQRQGDAAGLISALGKLSPLERQVFAGWLEADRRDPSPMERYWGEWRTLPEDARTAVRDALRGMGN
ncbi:hypothetical protein SLA_2607 [Streptomyces laurentii]|uniref:HNH endonuclease n=1 Tax=Streptomyces laurentii TaxID=39478 RepID=A0A160NZY0_STRLU|nr:hypothetical protein SLA_2607 [Streptomyces laurentii]